MLKKSLTVLSLVAAPLCAFAQTTTPATTTATTTSTTTPTTPTTTTTTTSSTTTGTSSTCCTSTTATATKTTHSEDKLIKEYTQLAGSKENATKLVTALRTGGDTKIGSETIKTPTGKMGVGNVKIALALTEAKLDQQGIEKPTTKQLNAALTDILKMRADGKGWGQIAHSMDLKLGDVMRHDGHHRHHHARDDRQDHHAKHERPEKHEKVERVAKLDKPERFEKPVRFEKPERPERPGK